MNLVVVFNFADAICRLLFGAPQVTIKYRHKVYL